MAYVHDGWWYIAKNRDTVAINNIGTERYVELPMEIFDALALMRYAQLREELGDGALPSDDPKRLNIYMHHVADIYPNLGSEALRRYLGLPTLMEEAQRLVDDT